MDVVYKTTFVSISIVGLRTPSLEEPERGKISNTPFLGIYEKRNDIALPIKNVHPMLGEMNLWLKVRNVYMRCQICKVVIEYKSASGYIIGFDFNNLIMYA